eukprot:763590-Hanusia_phi.AAC.4
MAPEIADCRETRKKGGVVTVSASSASKTEADGGGGGQFDNLWLITVPETAPDTGRRRSESSGPAN